MEDLLPGPEGSSPRELTDWAGTLFFAAPDRVMTGDGEVTSTVLWRSDGTAAGTSGLWPSSDFFSVLSFVEELTPFQGRLFFRGADLHSGIELWASDGTVIGTRPFRALQPGESGSFPGRFTPVGGTLFFTACQFFETSPESGPGCELWRTDGSYEGTVLVRDIRPGLDGSEPQALRGFGERLFLSADDGVHGAEPWVSDGTAEGTVLVKDLAPGTAGSRPRELTVAGLKLFFVADDGVHGPELWVSDGTAEGTALVEDIRRGPRSGLAEGAALTPGPAGTLLFAADDGKAGVEPWVSDGRRGGTRRLADIASGTRSSHPRELTLSGDRVYFVADDGASGEELWAIPIHLRPSLRDPS